MTGWVSVDVGLLSRLASVTVRVGDRSGSPGERLAAPAGLARVLVMAEMGQASGVLSVDAVVVPGRVTTISCLPWVDSTVASMSD
jgi:hypothetical protein